MARFADLSDDAMFLLFTYLTPQDYISLSQTCRNLYILTSMAHGWRWLRIDLPLNLDNRHEVSPETQRQELIRALKIDANWKGGSTRIKNQTRFNHGDFVYFVHLLRDDLVFTLSRSAQTGAAYLSAWKFGSKKSSLRRLGKVEPMYKGISLLPTRFSVAKHTREEKAVIAMFTETGLEGYLQFFSLSLRPEDWKQDALRPALFLQDTVDIVPKGASARIHDIQIHDSTIVASYTDIPQFPTSNTHFHEMIMLDIDNMHIRCVNIGNNENVVGDKFVFKLFPDSVLIITSRNEDGVASVYNLREILNSSPPANPSLSTQLVPIQETKSMLTQYHSKFFSAQYSIYLPVEAIPNTPTLVPVVAVHNKTGEAHLFQLGMPKGGVTEEDVRPRAVEPQASFQMKPSDKLDFVHIGPTGHRMVWIEILSADGQDIRIMKAILPSFGDKEAVVSELLPESQLPMKYNQCFSLWLDERRGRVCLSFLNEMVCILDL